MSTRCSPEDYAIALAKHFVQQYPRVGEVGNDLVDLPMPMRWRARTTLVSSELAGSAGLYLVLPSYIESIMRPR